MTDPTMAQQIEAHDITQRIYRATRTVRVRSLERRTVDGTVRLLVSTSIHRALKRVVGFGDLGQIVKPTERGGYAVYGIRCLQDAALSDGAIVMEVQVL